MLRTSRICITPPCIDDSWISTRPATGDAAPTSDPSEDAAIFMNAPVTCWPGTVLLTHASLTDTCANDVTGSAKASNAAATACIRLMRAWYTTARRGDVAQSPQHGCDTCIASRHHA